MRKLTAMVDHLLAATGLPREQIHAFADKGQLQPTGRHLGRTEDGLEQIEAGVWRYDGIVYLERYAGDGQTLMALILGWLADNDDDRDGLTEPELDVDVNDAITCDIELACEFEERLTLVEDPRGPVPFDGRLWRIEEPHILAAQDCEVKAARGR